MFSNFNNFMTPLFKKLAAVSMLLVLAACGGGGGGSSSGPIAPSLTIDSDTATVLPSNFKLNFYFTGPVVFPNGYLDGDINVVTDAGTTVVATADTSTFQRIGNTNAYSMEFNIPVGSKGDFTFTVPKARFKDGTGTVFNNSVTSFTHNYESIVADGPTIEWDYEFLETYPQCVLAPNNLPYVCGVVTIRFEFDKVLDNPGLELSQVKADNGTLSNLVTKSAVGQPNVYEVTYTPISLQPNQRYTDSLKIAFNSVSAAGQPNKQAISKAFLVGHPCQQGLNNNCD